MANGLTDQNEEAGMAEQTDVSANSNIDIPTEKHALVVEVVPGFEGGPPYIWIGGADGPNFLDTISPEMCEYLRDTLTAALRKWRR